MNSSFNQVGGFSLFYFLALLKALGVPVVMVFSRVWQFFYLGLVFRGFMCSCRNIARTVLPSSLSLSFKREKEHLAAVFCPFTWDMCPGCMWSSISGHYSPCSFFFNYLTYSCVFLKEGFPLVLFEYQSHGF